MAPPRSPGKSSPKNNKVTSPTGSPSNKAALRKNVVVETINTLEEFGNIMETENRLVVLDVFSAWCGPCKQMHPTFKALQANIDEFSERVVLYEVELTTIPSFLTELNFKESSQPRFLFYLKGKLEHMIDEINAPEILRTIDEFMPSVFDVQED
eukprot:GEMP01100422.1.p1 GENE.GEMP01100422.1~~GEMP01100422.1.p1  ORF type:complete len:154 (+),score=29.31 GEMP01100422.1:66-527(+)